MISLLYASETEIVCFPGHTAWTTAVYDPLLWSVTYPGANACKSVLKCLTCSLSPPLFLLSPYPVFNVIASSIESPILYPVFLPGRNKTEKYKQAEPKLLVFIECCMNRICFYVAIADFSLKVHLECIIVLKFKVKLCYKLEIKAGRWARPNKAENERLYNIWNCLEDEYHFVLDCQLHDSVRRKYRYQFYWKWSIMSYFFNNCKLLSNQAIWTV